MSVNHCLVCGSERSDVFLERRGVPAHQNVPYATRAQATNSARGILRMRACADCGFVWNEAFDPTLIEYGPAYDNTQNHSPRFDTHMRDLADRILRRAGGRPVRIVEVGCGKGDFLRLLVDDEASGNVGVGFDPTHQGLLEEFGGRLRFEHRFFDRSCVAFEPDVVVCRHVIEHIQHPLELARELRLALGDRNVRLYFETPDVDWILRNEVIWDFFYEHCSLFTAAALRGMFERAGFRVGVVEHVFGGQYLWLEATTEPTAPAPSPRADADAELARRFGAAERQLVDEWTTRLAALGQHGSVAVWGGGAKGVTLANLCDPTAARIDCVVDINPEKQGRFVAGTGHPLVAPSVLAEREVRSVILLNANYEHEVRGTMRHLGLSCDLIVA